MKALSIYPNAVIHAQLAAGFCANRWAEEFSNHSRCSTGHRPNEFILKFSPRSIVIRFFVSLTLLKFVYRGHVWWHSSQDKGIPTKSRYWRFDTMHDNLEIRRTVVCFPTSFKSSPSCLELSSLIIPFSFIHSWQSRANVRFAKMPWQAVCDYSSSKRGLTSVPALHLWEPGTR